MARENGEVIAGLAQRVGQARKDIRAGIVDLRQVHVLVVAVARILRWSRLFRTGRIVQFAAGMRIRGARGSGAGIHFAKGQAAAHRVGDGGYEQKRYGFEESHDINNVPSWAVI